MQIEGESNLCKNLKKLAIQLEKLKLLSKSNVDGKHLN